MTIRHAVEIGAPPEAVFDFLVDPASFPVVDPALVEWSPHEGMRVGLTGTFVHRRGGMTARSTWRAVELDRPTRIRIRVRGSGYELDEIAKLAAAGFGTRAVFVDVVRPTSLAGRVLVALSGAIMRRDLARLAQLLQAALDRGAVGEPLAAAGSVRTR